MTFYGYHIEAHRVVCVSAVSRDECSGGANKLLLFSMVNSVASGRKCGGCSGTYFDERQTITLDHYEVDFAAAAAIVSAHGRESLPEQIAQRDLFRTLAFYRCG